MCATMSLTRLRLIGATVVRRQLFFSLATFKTFVTIPFGGGAAFYVAERQRSGVKSRPPAARILVALPIQSFLLGVF
jgi:hypothetical protein